MSRPPTHNPKMYPHASSGQWCVNLSGVRVYLGKDKAEATEKYKRVVAEWLLQGHAPPRTRQTPARGVASNVLTVNGALLAYRQGMPAVCEAQVDRIDYAIEAASELYGNTSAQAFDQLCLQGLRDHLVRRRSRRGKPPAPGEPDTRPFLSRNYVNALIGCIQTAWIWLASRKLVSGQAAMDLRTVKSLRENHGGRETEDVLPVDRAVVEKTLAEVGPIIQAMIRIEQLTGMRPGELVLMRGKDISRAVDEWIQPPAGPKVSAVEVEGVLVWVYAPRTHKMLHKGKPRVIAIGPRAQAVLAPFLAGRDPEAYLFDPRESMAEWRARQHKARKTKVQPSQVTRAAARKPDPKKAPGVRYTPDSYAQAIERAARRAGVEHWTGQRLRHAMATDTAEDYDYDTAAATLGHSKPDMTAHYARLAIKRAALRAAQQG